MSDEDDLDILPTPDTLIRRLLDERSKRFDPITFADKLIDAFDGMDGLVSELKTNYEHLQSDIARSSMLKEIMQAIKIANQMRAERSQLYEIPADELPGVLYQALAAYGVSKKTAGTPAAAKDSAGGPGPGKLAGEAPPAANG